MKFITCALILVIGYNLSYAQNIKTDAKVDKDKVMVGELFEYQILVAGNFRTSPGIIIPELENFKIISRQQVFNYQVEKDKIKAKLTYKFSLTALKEGEFEITGFKLKFGSKELEVQPLKIKVEGIKEMPKEEKEPEGYEFGEEGIWI